jgi:hypothetical protein
MKIYFGFTVAGDRSSVDYARHIVSWLESRGHEVLTRHLVSDAARESDRALGASEVFNRDMRWLEAADIFIAEVSGSSFGLGFEAGYVLGSSEKKVVLFYREESAGKISLLITGNTHRNCTVTPYQTIAQVEKVLQTTLT